MAKLKRKIIESIENKGQLNECGSYYSSSSWCGSSSSSRGSWSSVIKQSKAQETTISKTKLGLSEVKALCKGIVNRSYWIKFTSQQVLKKQDQLPPELVTYLKQFESLCTKFVHFIDYEVKEAVKNNKTSSVKSTPAKKTSTTRSRSYSYGGCGSSSYGGC